MEQLILTLLAEACGSAAAARPGTDLFETGLLDSLLARDWAALGHCVGLLAPFGVGVVLGIFLIAKLIEWLFKKFPSQTYAAIIGLIVASPFGILYSSGALESFSTIGLIVGLVLGAAGGWVTWLMGEKEPA